MLVGLVTGAWLGVLLGIATLIDNDPGTFADGVRLHGALVTTFALLLGAAGAAIALVGAIVRRQASPAVTFAIVSAVTAAVWGARWFEFRLAYPDRWPFVNGFAGMAALAGAFLVLLALAAWFLGRGLHAAARAVPGITAGRAVIAAVATALASALVLSLRPPLDPGVPPSPPSVSPDESRVLVVGCDGCEWKVIDALLAEGELPEIARLLESGVRAPLRTLRDRPSPSLWTSIASSRSPRDTGIRDFYVQTVFGSRTPIAAFPRHFGLNGGLLLRDVLGSRRVRVTPVSSTMVRTKPLWTILDEAGVGVGVVGWLVTWPARPEGSVLVVSDRAFAAGGSEAALGLWSLPAPADTVLPSPASFSSEDAYHGACARRIAERWSPQVLMVYFRDVDAAEHLAWNEWEPAMFPGAGDRSPRRGPVRDAYVRLDREIAKLCRTVGPDANVVVVSDHGHGAWFTWFGRGTPGGHTDSPDGIFLAAGPGIRPGATPDRPSLYDVAPTVLRLLGLPTAADMEGRALLEILTDDAPLPRIASYGEASSPRSTEPLPEDTEAELERLRALGYVR